MKRMGQTAAGRVPQRTERPVAARATDINLGWAGDINQIGRHCEERSDAAIQSGGRVATKLDCFAALAMTG